ncbi:hypothetical protein WFM01_17375 [Yersinia enterocolitica]
MLGIMPARLVSSFLTQLFSCHSVFFASAQVMAALVAVLPWKLPPRLCRV